MGSFEYRGGTMLNKKVQIDSLKRLNKIEGQIKGIQRMIEKKKYCIDIINQTTAVRRALEQVSMVIMKCHIESCVTEAIKKNRSREKIDELMESFYRFLK